MSAQGSERVVVFTSSKNPAAESSWTLTLLVAHHEPNDVTVLAPHFTGSLLLDQVIKVRRFYSPSTGQSTSSANEVRASAVPWAFEHWTAVEFRFTLNSPGVITFEAFTVITPQWQVKTAPFDLNVQRARNTAQIQSHRPVWEGAPASLNVGKEAIFSLRINGWNSTNVLPETELFLPPVPPGHILESVLLTPDERSAGLALRLRLIPLEETPFVLESRRFFQDAALFEIPSLRIPVSRAAANTEVSDEPAEEAAGAAVPFPPLSIAAESNAGLYQKYTADCEAAYAVARGLWEKEDRAAALAELRRSERNHPAGGLFAVIRRSAEQSIGLFGAYDEKKGIWSFFRGRFSSPSAVLRNTIVRRVPNVTGTEIARFKEGQPVVLDRQYPEVREDNIVWLRVITSDDNRTSGWVPKENIIFY